MNRLLLSCLATAFLFGAFPLSSRAEESATLPKFDANRLRTGRFDHRIMKAGEQIGTFSITIEKQRDGSLRFAARGFNQEWESIASASFAPISAALRIERFTRKETYAMKLNDAGDRVTGWALTTSGGWDRRDTVGRR